VASVTAIGKVASRAQISALGLVLLTSIGNATYLRQPSGSVLSAGQSMALSAGIVGTESCCTLITSYRLPMMNRCGTSSLTERPFAKAVIDSNITKPRELLGTLSETISSQAVQEWAEGSTTRAWSRDPTVKPHERAAPRGDDIVWTVGRLTEGGIKSPSITQSVIWELDPMDTWASTNLDKVDANSTLHDWLSDNLAAAAANINIEGDDASFSTAAPAERMGNFTQIVRKTFIVSGTLEAVKKAGRASERKRLGTKFMKELKRDIEFALVRNAASTLGGAGTGRSSAGMESWIEGPTASTVNTAANVVAATTTAASATTPGFSGGAVAAPTDGTTTGALTESHLKLALQGAWEDGGDPRVILCSANNKNTIDQFAGVATRMVDVDRTAKASIIASANVYVHSYGSPSMVVLSRYTRSSVVLCLDPDYWAIAFLRRPFMEQLAKTGDAEKHEMLAEFTLVCRNQFASSKVVAIA
jgi:hypothetical protein